jgi:hypothetical protein
LAAFDAIVRVGQRRLVVVADLLVEGLVLGVGDLALAAGPQRGGLVDRFPLVGVDLFLLLLVPFALAHQDGQRDVVRVLADDRLELPPAEELVLAFAQVQRHVGATGRLVDGLDLEVAGALAAPAYTLGGRQAGAA